MKKRVITNNIISQLCWEFRVWNPFCELCLGKIIWSIIKSTVSLSLELWKYGKRGILKKSRNCSAPWEFKTKSPPSLVKQKENIVSVIFTSCKSLENEMTIGTPCRYIFGGAHAFSSTVVGMWEFLSAPSSCLELDVGDSDPLQGARGTQRNSHNYFHSCFCCFSLSLHILLFLK